MFTREVPSVSTCTMVIGLFQVQPKNVPFSKTVDVPCLLFHAAVFIHLKSLCDAHFKLCKLSFVWSEGLHVWVPVCVCVCVCMRVHVHAL